VVFIEELSAAAFLGAVEPKKEIKKQAATTRNLPKTSKFLARMEAPKKFSKVAMANAKHGCMP
jgi:hypothetical protein